MTIWNPDQVTYLLKVAGGVGSLAGLGIVVSTYYRNERWKRAEFLANEMKEFFATPRVQKALVLIDWGERRMNLLEDGSAEETSVTVTRAMQVRGLKPHVLLVGDGSDSEMVVSEDGSRREAFRLPEAAIRDCYDAFLDGLERFSSYVKTGLIEVASLRPYIGYWVESIASPTSNRDDAAWCATLLTYIRFYGFDGVLWLFKAFGKNIEPGSDIYRSFLLGMTDQKLASDLAGTVGQSHPHNKTIANSSHSLQ
jgi:hypothetical protein